MNIGIIHTASSPCRCAEAIEKGLSALGHKALKADSEDILLKAPDLVTSCDLLIDHSDTFLGRGYLRFFVRSILEYYGAMMVGSCADACRFADNKIAAKACLGKVGIAVPPNISVNSNSWNMPAWLKPPFVVKAAFEHMSRGTELAHTEDEARKKAGNLIEQTRQPVMIEMFIAGRELAVSVIDGPEGLEVLPPLEWYSSSENIFLAEKLKLLEPTGKTRPEASRAELTPFQLEEIEKFVSLAFKSLCLSDYARFDIRLTESGTFFFLEANVTPSLEPLEALAISACWAGISYPELMDRMLSSAIKRHNNIRPEGIERCKSKSVAKNKSSAIKKTEILIGGVKLDVPEGVHPPFQSSVELAKLLDIRSGEKVLDLGCGSGILSIASAKLGAGYVCAVDLDPLSLETTLKNADKNGVKNIVKVQAGSWYEALNKSQYKPDSSRFDVIIATPPQTPAPEPFSPRYGGPDGTTHLLKIIDGAADFLLPDNGRLWLLLITLANAEAVINVLYKRFRKVETIHETSRYFTADEYNAMYNGLMEYLHKLRASGKSEFTETPDGNYKFRNLFIRAAGPI